MRLPKVQRFVIEYDREGAWLYAIAIPEFDAAHFAAVTNPNAPEPMAAHEVPDPALSRTQS